MEKNPTPWMLNMTKRFMAVFMSLDAYPDARRINGGWCYIWAWIVYNILPDVELYIDGPDYIHAWVKYNGRYYDSEVPDGVDRFCDIPCNRRWDNSCNARRMTPEAFFEDWADVGSENGRRYFTYDQQTLIEFIKQEAEIANKEVAA
jgi:hypothetical protein